MLGWRALAGVLARARFRAQLARCTTHSAFEPPKKTTTAKTATTEQKKTTTTTTTTMTSHIGGVLDRVEHVVQLLGGRVQALQQHPLEYLHHLIRVLLQVQLHRGWWLVCVRQ